jgi:hypothetical protein
MFYTYSNSNPKKQKKNISLIQSIHPHSINTPTPIVRNNMIDMIDRIEKQKLKQTRCLSCH